MHIWKNTDSDLIDLPIMVEIPAYNGKPATHQTEVIHTTSEHPFLTVNQGFMPVGKLKVGGKVQSANGGIGIVTDWKMVSTTKVMYNLGVAYNHTFSVGDDQWIVHNNCVPQDYVDLQQNMTNAGVSWLNGQQAHHVIPCSLSDHALVQAANDLFEKNAAYTGRALFNKLRQHKLL